MKKIFNYFLESLNNNDKGLVYRGNFLFQLDTDKLSVYDQVENKLVREKIIYRPVAITVSEDITYVEDNKRVDSLLEFGIVVPIKGQTYNDADDLDYANIKRVCEELNGAELNVDGTKYAVKTSPYPKFSGFAYLGNSKRIILSVTINFTEVEKGEFGQVSEWYLDDVLLDVVEPQVNTTRIFYTNDKKNTSDNNFNNPIGRAKVVNLIVNYDPDNAKCVELFKETRSAVDLNKTYQLKEVHDTGIYINNVIVRSATDVTQRNSVRKISVELVEVI